MTRVLPAVLPAVPPDVMTWRARGYLGISAARHFAVGAYVLALPGDFTADAYQVIREILPMRAWGVLFLLGGLHMAYAALAGREPHARTGLTFSAVASACWAAGFLMGYYVGGVVTLLGFIVFAALTGKDLVVCAQPMRSPFERIVREYTGSTGR